MSEGRGRWGLVMDGWMDGFEFLWGGLSVSFWVFSLFFVFL